ncbi:D-lactate dehydrogenase [Dysgonomonas sp. PFB1-18]|uniref:FAD-binding and (Fe-S)-binding domain-containing protein n=1 Tax=unclassified Dysgonomonas TaxID=2630389 RepID=UPI0024767FC7|nr:MULTISPECIES: FAD-binding and (Fe-S)-binding domain-containing protein [unclassified Dysgonomonas]MDH6308972.1 D-lactate dehydrogenase [Dysgonomonas sp. PF1-14]MDH6338723.1 D-lactate dehydrogenase [Dysgonomonas sp. PF1-16]MDH6380249.1 D-lactate dehydrogenase [Dysgonomonas sp. PFB1-18]MDH6397579.1 D-lactate dehydrogenase [Dysgonomonas sp. PF1-23]
MLPANYQQLKDELSRTIPAKRIITNPLQLLAYGTDASFYRLIPKIVVQVHSEEEAVEVIRQTARLNIPVTYRAAGTSLSGQAISDSVLMVATHEWRKYTILDDEALAIKLQPGITGARANVYLKPFGRKIGPDPASINAAMIGGIASNNASGMCCGTDQNSYKTIADIRIVLYDGTILDTADENSKKAFREKHSEIIKEIEQLRDEIKADNVLNERIKRKFKIKNTTGYSINALVDYEDPIDIIKHLMIGSEGTLAFISDITYNTVVDEKYKACTLMIYETIETACDVVPLLKQTPVSAVELLDRDSIRSIEDDPEAPAYFRALPETACLLLVEIQGDNTEIMEQKEKAIREAIVSIPTIQPYRFTSDPKEYNFNWKARKGLLSSIGGLRKTGTTCLIEDVAFPVARLGEACVALKELFKRAGYSDAVLYGHALDGNFHIVFSQDFNTPSEVQRYADMMDELADIVVNKFDGSLKAEHGTGRNMAPFVEKEWGEAAYKIMLRIKKAFDPNHLINPGVVINENPKIHLENLKPLPAVNEIVDKCMECGFCEPNCVAEGLTLSPRQRIVIAREISRLTAMGEDAARLKQMLHDAKYYSDETCATDGLCGLVCPVKIDTGKFIKDLRHTEASPTAHKIAGYIGSHMAGTTSIARGGLNFVNAFHTLLGSSLMGGIASAMRTVSFKAIPKWNRDMPKGAHKIKDTIVNDGQPDKVVYFPSCINRSMGKSKGYEKGDVELTRKTIELLERAGFTIIYPEGINSLCCGMAFSSKGLKEEGARKSQELEGALLKASENGKYPVLFDMSPCFYTFHEAYTNKNLKIYDPVEFMLDFVMPKLEVKHPREVVTVFTVCSVKKIGMEQKLLELAKLCSKEVAFVESNCCGFAGDRGFTYPELNKHGLRHLNEQVPADCKDGYSTSRTCEIGMSEYSDINFKSIFYLIDEVTK